MTKKIFWLILVLAFILRFYKLGAVPLSMDWDENSNAYNAYSIFKTGRDEYGDFLPITNRSFDDYKPPLYMYLNIPAVAVFGLTPFAARLPSAVFGFLTVPVLYFLAKKLFENSKLKFDIPTVAMLMLAISPWHLQFSRVGFEATVGLFFAVAAITAFLYGLVNKKWLILSALALGISAYSYHAERIFVPFLFVAAFIIWKKEIWSVPKKYLVVFAVIAILIALPLVVLIPPRVILQRFEVTTGRPRLEDIEKSIKFILQDQNLELRFGRYIHNRRFVIGQTWFGNYLSHFDFNFLFTKGDDNFRHHIGNMGMVYLFQLPLILYGVFLLVKNRNKTSAFLLAWLLIAPIPATPAVPNPHGNRSLPMDPALQIISAYALVSIFSIKFLFKRHVQYFYILWIGISVIVYLHNYWRHYPYDKADFWQYGYKEAVLEAEKFKDQFEKINIDHSIEQAYIFWLFNTKYDPTSYQQQGTRYHFDKYYFDAKAPETKNDLFVSDPGNFPGSFEVVKTIYYPNGQEAIKIGHPR
ncbi:hypothetical protein A3I53_01225 [Candidatus Curtissbacteria bacterium RIFCSPLOWO2_02_FULL_40_13b]|uniref:Glycosyltransferase RgtA/B/C/D-like domain-containing protein n=2 Tax=Candidatus Curtissiibacteriota TaxID=1752717 RepID=A0A1F5HY37_9BACT|nr:MAG: hypothetical protein A3I53_01225 [Candidatus Curtissbacteria bacterium RIFCSPLOWO2_02_FULL_40_13b]